MMLNNGIFSFQPWSPNGYNAPQYNQQPYNPTYPQQFNAQPVYQQRPSIPDSGNFAPQQYNPFMADSGGSGMLPQHPGNQLGLLGGFSGSSFQRPGMNRLAGLGWNGGFMQARMGHPAIWRR